MLDANYIKHWKNIGKFAYLYDTAGSNETALKTLRATMMDQAATGASSSLPASDIVARMQPAFASAIVSGPTALQSVAVGLGTRYLQSTYFTDDLTTRPASNAITDIIAALETEMSAGVDNKTLTTLGSTGLVHFLNVLLGSSGTWNTAADGSADYKDSVYVVSAVV